MNGKIIRPNQNMSDTDLLNSLVAVLTNTGLQNTPEEAVSALAELLGILEKDSDHTSVRQEFLQASSNWKEFAASLTRSKAKASTQTH